MCRTLLIWCFSWQKYMLPLRADHWQLRPSILLLDLFIRVYSVVHFSCPENPKPVSLSNWKEEDATSRPVVSAQMFFQRIHSSV
ncbi:hypothetical protein RHGRI_017136 [Rhododendron griersonianum]|uniref:Uncharacterized protein n=1 Tax=Rhododendron griersonianum TaxID=479676 RepID=A0AAV6JWQ1_9ERIC|nr:hypothetical protein RHGRI_017136 [Rhododendron griersonianum]